MSTRPTRTPRPTEKAAASQKKSNAVAKSPSVKIEKSVSPAKRKARMSSGSEIEIVDEPSVETMHGFESLTVVSVLDRHQSSGAQQRPAFVLARVRRRVTSTMSPSANQRGRQTDDSFFTNRSPPSTPSPSKPRGHAHTTVPDRENVSPNKRNTSKVLAAMHVYSDDDPERGPTEAEDITDPEFFDDAPRDSPPGEGMQYDSEDYWRDVEPMTEFDAQFIDDSAVVDEAPSSKKRTVIAKKHSAHKVVVSSDEEDPPTVVNTERPTADRKKYRVISDDLSDYSRKELTASKSKGKKKAVAVVSPLASSEDEDGEMTKAEIAQMAEAK
ncbi:hypothetical protein HWV62_29364 [Athelia sp. TMB]|nr:hypothetical protein HWV62_29364 [Athelia sp. TMB]